MATVGALELGQRREPGTHRLKNEMAQRVIDKITRYAPNFRDIVIRHITFAPYHMQTMFGAPSGDFCHGLLHPDLMGPNRPGPKGFVDLPIPITGLYLASAGCHGGPGITFTPGYNAAYQALDDVGAKWGRDLTQVTAGIGVAK